MAEVRMETQVDPLVVMILTIQMAMVDKEDHLTEGVTMEILEEVAVTNHTSLMEMVDKEVHSMEEVIMETMEVAHLVATTLIIQMEMVDKGDHLMMEDAMVTQEVEGPLVETTHTIPREMVVHSMVVAIMVILVVVPLVETILIIQMEMVVKEDHSMAEVIIIILGEAAEDIFTVPVQM